MILLKEEVPELMKLFDYEQNAIFPNNEALNQYANKYVFLNEYAREITATNPSIDKETVAYSIYYWITYVVKYYELHIGSNPGLLPLLGKAVETVDRITQGVDTSKLQAIESEVIKEIG